MSDPQIRLLVVYGSDGGREDHTVEASFKTLYDFSDISPEIAPNDQVAFGSDFRPDVDVLLLYNLSVILAPEYQANLRSFAESGKGIFVLHSALCNYQDWEWWWRDVVGGRLVLDPPGSASFMENQTLRANGSLDHPVTAFLGGLPLAYTDETFKGVWVNDEVTPILTTGHTTSDHIIGWISPFQSSRVIAIQPGHGRDVHYNWGFRQLFKNAVLWAAGRL